MKASSPPVGIPLAMLGVTHREAAVGLREKLVLDTGQWAELLQSLRQAGLADGGVYLATCNRTEFYLATSDADAALAHVQGALASRLDDADLAALEWTPRTGRAAIHHLFRVTASLDSLVLGDTEILGQVRGAYERARAAEQTDKLLHQVFQAALRAGKDVRTSTGIQQRAASVASLVAQELRRLPGTGSIVVLGAGEIAQAVLRNLKKAGPRLVVLNRSEASLEALRQDHQFTGGRLADFIQHMDGAAALVSCLAVDRPLIEAAALAAATWGRPRPLAIYDLGVPRNVDPLARTLPGVILQDMDDLQAVVEANRAGRAEAAAEAEERIVTHLDDFEIRWHLQPLAPVLALVRGRKAAPPAELGDLLEPHLAKLPPAAIHALARQLGPALGTLPAPLQDALGVSLPTAP